MKLLYKSFLEGVTLSLCKFNMSYRRLFIAMAVMYCGFASVSTQAQSLDTLLLRASYAGGIWLSSDTTLAYKTKIAIPNSVYFYTSAPNRHIKLRYTKTSQDTITIDYTSGSENSRIGTISNVLEVDTVYTTYLSFAVDLGDSITTNDTVISIINLPFESKTIASDVPCQNLAQNCSELCNGGFNTLTAFCVAGGSNLNSAPHWTHLDYSPDYFTPCDTLSEWGIPYNKFGVQNNFGDVSGGYAGIYAGVNPLYGEGWNWRESFRQILSTGLQENRKYVAGCRVSLAEKSTHTSNNIGLSVHNLEWGPLANDGLSERIYSKTQIIDTSWVLISGEFEGKEYFNSITVGAFTLDSTLNLARPNVDTISMQAKHGAYYYIDDVFIIPVPSNVDAVLTATCGSQLELGETTCDFIHHNMTIRWVTSDSLNMSAYNNQLVIVVTPDKSRVYKRIVVIGGYEYVSSYNVIVNNQNRINIAGANLRCLPDNNMLSTQFSPIGLAQQLQEQNIIWKRDGVQVGTGFTHTPTMSGTYIAEIINITCPAADTIEVTVVPEPPAITLNIPSVVCADNAFTASSNFVNGDNGQYTWSVLNAANNQPATGVTIAPNANANTVAITFENGGKYLVQITVVSGINSACTKTYSQEIAVVGNCCVKNSAGAAIPVSQLVLLGNPYKEITYTSGNFPQKGVADVNYFVVGNINIIPESSSLRQLSLTRPVFYMRGMATAGSVAPSVHGTFLTIEKGAGFTGNSATFTSACDTMWGGIRVKGIKTGITTTAITLSGTSALRNSYEGILLEKLVNTVNPSPGPQPLSVNEDKPPLFRLQGVEFRNNYYSVQLKNMGAGDYNPSDNNWQSIRSNIFESDSLIFPFHGNGGKGSGSRTFAHLRTIGKSGLGWESSGAARRFSSNRINNALYGIFALEHEHSIYGEGNTFTHNRIAAVYHTGGNLSLLGGFGNGASLRTIILLPNDNPTTDQITSERAARSLNAEGGLLKPSFGVYAANGCNDLLAQNLTMRSDKNQPIANGDSLPYNHIGYFGRGVNLTMAENSLRGDNPNGIWFMKHGVQLIGAGNYTIQATGFVNNKKAIVFGTDANNPVTLGDTVNSLVLRCNEFVRQPSGTSPVTFNIQNTSCTAIEVGSQVTVAKIGGVVPAATNLQNRPAGNEVRSTLDTCKVFDNLGNGICQEVPAIGRFTFIRNLNTTSSFFHYYRYKQENVDLVQTSGNAYVTNTYENATNYTCFSNIGVLNRMSNTNAITAIKGFLDSRSVLLEQNYPNPVLYGSTEIKYGFPTNAEGMSLVVYDLRSGQKITEQALTQAEGIVTLHTEKWTAGIYSYCLVQQGRVITAKKMAIGQ